MRVPQRGRAIVRRLPARAERQTFRPGDFLLVRTAGFLPGMERLASGGMLNHAALIVDPSGALIEVDPRLSAGRLAVRRGHLRDYLDAGDPCWVGYVEVQEGTRALVVDFAKNLLAASTPVSEVGLAALTLHALMGVAPRARTARHGWLRPLHPFFDRHALVLREEHTYLSGELVARALERGGFVWDCDPAYVTPAALFERFLLRDEPDGGVLVPLAWARKVKGKSGGAPATPPNRGPARVSALVPRVAGPAEPAESAVDPALPLVFPAPAPSGVRALIQLALLTAGSLAVVHSIESLARQRQRP